jgi:hypothetical protein
MGIEGGRAGRRSMEGIMETPAAARCGEKAAESDPYPGFVALATVRRATPTVGAMEAAGGPAAGQANVSTRPSARCVRVVTVAVIVPSSSPPEPLPEPPLPFALADAKSRANEPPDDC